MLSVCRHTYVSALALTAVQVCEWVVKCEGVGKEAAAAYRLLQQELTGELGRQVWGVIQQAFNIMVEVYKNKVSAA